MNEEFKKLLVIAADRPLDTSEATEAFQMITAGEVTPAQMGGFLMVLQSREQNVTEITAAASVLREKAVPVQAPANAIDIVGTGGDGKGTLNVSTATALVVAATGLPVAKHGNQAQSSKSGAADVLSALGVEISVQSRVLEAELAEARMGFMMAPIYHPAMRHVAPIRRELGTRTIFNLLGPLTNPAGVRRQLTGVFHNSLRWPMVEALKRLGSEAAWVVHAHNGEDEISISGKTLVSELIDGKIREWNITPEDAGLPRHSPEVVAGGDARENAIRIRELLDGQKSGFRDAVLLNAAGAMVMAEQAKDLVEGVEQAAQAIDSGKAFGVLEKLVQVSRKQV